MSTPTINIRHDTQFEDHFPIHVMVSHHTGVDAINLEISEIMRNLRALHSTDNQENEALSGTITTYGGYQTSKKMMFLDRKDAAIHRLHTEVILPGAARYLYTAYDNKVEPSLTRMVSWANILSAGDWQAPHMHPTAGNLASGVYYVAVPEKPKPEGCIEFLNPHPVSHHHGISLTRRLYPQTGDLIIFPPYYIHYVYPFKGDGDRAIIAFDVILRNTQFVF
ncbi:MAG TPA: putative 2OG-Fe(II) oxygenase [Gammaproteobacteria bacterium]|nr:putative 2OG-Fe(II) oxygenase [Gammaproteobacteria bacterium]